MRIFMTGAGGYIGSAVAEALMAAGHSVVGAFRTAEGEEELKARDIVPVGADLATPESLRLGLEQCNGYIHAGTTNDGVTDAHALDFVCRSLSGSGKKFIYTSGCWVYGNTGEGPVDESAPLNPPAITAWRPAVEREVLNAGGVVIRPGIVYGRGGGVPGMFVQSAFERGVAHYPGDGRNRWTLVHVEDLAELYVKAFENGGPGSLWNGVDGQPVPLREITEAASFGAGAGGKAEPWPDEAAWQTLGVPLVDALKLDQSISGEKAKRELGWKPDGISVLEDLRYGSYAMSRINP